MFCVTQPDVIGAVVLGAGAPMCMGRAKQVLEFCGQSLMTRAASVALEAGCLPVVVVVVTGANAAASRESLRGLNVGEVENQQWHSGMGEAAAVPCYTNVSSVDCPRGSLNSISNEGALITSTVARKNPARAQSRRIFSSRYLGNERYVAQTKDDVGRREYDPDYID
jgi:MobA-like NTP transferase domain